LIFVVVASCAQTPLLARAAATVEDRLANQPRSEYRARRQKLMGQIKDGIVVLIGALEEDLGEVGRFRQKNNFMYLAGAETPDSFLLLVPADVIAGKAAEETLFIPPRNTFQERWTGVKIGPGAEAEKKFGFGEVAGADKFYDRLRDLFARPEFKDAARPAKLYTVVPRGSTAPVSREYHFVEWVRRTAPHVQVADISYQLAEMRKVKSASEAELLQKAVDITGEAQREAALKIKPGAFEYEAQAALEAAFTRNGAERSGFPAIVGAGLNSTILHYMENRARIEPGDLVVVDIGAEYSYYTADITRTYPSVGKFTDRQREVYKLVLDAQRACEKSFKPGQTTWGQLQRTAADVMRASTLRDGQGSTLERYFIHGLGHYLGMDVHDVGDNSKPIPVGAAITIEPGIYITNEKLGVRIEDDYLVTETGLVKLSRRIPSEPDEIERLMSEQNVNKDKRP
jgi:Xaa-Pro aminopeptidase